MCEIDFITDRIDDHKCINRGVEICTYRKKRNVVKISYEPKKIWILRYDFCASFANGEV